jgi:hypothetical protein
VLAYLFKALSWLARQKYGVNLIMSSAVFNYVAMGKKKTSVLCALNMMEFTGTVTWLYV